MKKLYLFLVAMCCVIAMHAEVVHHAQSQPGKANVGYAQECWENTETGKIYADAGCTQELNRAAAILYPKLPSEPYNYVLGNWDATEEYKEIGGTVFNHAEYSSEKKAVPY